MPIIYINMFGKTQKERLKMTISCKLKAIILQRPSPHPGWQIHLWFGISRMISLWCCQWEPSDIRQLMVTNWGWAFYVPPTATLYEVDAQTVAVNWWVLGTGRTDEVTQQWSQAQLSASCGIIHWSWRCVCIENWQGDLLVHSMFMNQNVQRSTLDSTWHDVTLRFSQGLWFVA